MSSIIALGATALTGGSPLLDSTEPHLSNVKQLTFGGQNAEAYWNVDGTKLVYQSMQPEYPDEQIFTMNPDGSDKKLISTGLGRCTCSYFSPDGKSIYFSSTHEYMPGPQPPLDMSKGYFWMVNPWFTMYRTAANGPAGNPHPELVLRKFGYTAETTISPDGKYMVWCSDFQGDLEIYRSDLNGGNIKRLTHEVGYDGGPFVSWDGKHIVYRRDTFTTPDQVEDYKNYLKQNLVRPTHLEIWIMDADGSNKRQLTRLNCASFAPFMSPDNKKVLFSSNYGDPQGREFDIFMINADGSGLERVTKSPQFDGFPMWSRDGKRLVFASNRNGKSPHETNIFVADWNP